MPVRQESPLVSSDLDFNATKPVPSPKIFENQTSSSDLYSANLLSGVTTESKPSKKRLQDDSIHITVGDPAKIGEVSLILRIFRSINCKSNFFL